MKKNSKHCGREFPGMNEYSNVVISADEVRDVVRRFERQLKSGRVFFPGDAPFAMKCETLLKSAEPDIEGLSVSGRSFTATDKTLYSEGDTPKVVSVGEDDIIALLDNTKKGLFGSLANKECSLGTIVTTKGVLTYHKVDGKDTCGSGFATWPSIAVSPYRGYSTALFCDSSNYNFPHGPRVWLYFSNARIKGYESSLFELVSHLVAIAQGRGGEFDYDETRPEGAGDVED